MNMEKMALDVPNLWADHHVLDVRDALASLEGIGDVYVSSAWKQILVNYDADKTDEATIEKALLDAGYPVGEGGVPILVEPNDLRRDPQWEILGARLTQTNRADLEMSGEFRRY
ncbi:MAG TPA: copper chaperone [Chloroflexi bacterium]|nr:copper chaperone [Chloroflexota bacterium]